MAQTLEEVREFQGTLSAPPSTRSNCQQPHDVSTIVSGPACSCPSALQQASPVRPQLYVPLGQGVSLPDAGGVEEGNGGAVCSVSGGGKLSRAGG